MTPTTTTQVLTDALAAIKTRGWCQNMGYELSTGRSCAIGAISIAADAVPHAFLFAVRAFEQANGLDMHYIPVWNDQPERTIEDVVIAFELAILESKRDDG